MKKKFSTPLFIPFLALCVFSNTSVAEKLYNQSKEEIKTTEKLHDLFRRKNVVDKIHSISGDFEITDNHYRKSFQTKFK